MNKENNNIKEIFDIDGKEVALYSAQESSSPLIVLNQFSGDGSDVLEEVRKLTSKDFHLLCVSNINWNHDMSPWFCPPIMSQDTDYTLVFSCKTQTKNLTIKDLCHIQTVYKFAEQDVKVILFYDQYMEEMLMLHERFGY